MQVLVSAHQCSTTDVFGCTSRRHRQQELVAQYFSTYITNPTVSPESHVVAVAQQLTTALKGNIRVGNETAEALKKVSELFTKIAAAKNKTAKAKEQRNRVRATPAA